MNEFKRNLKDLYDDTLRVVLDVLRTTKGKIVSAVGAALIVVVSLLIAQLGGATPAPTPTPTPAAVEATIPAIPPQEVGGVDGEGALPGGKNQPLGLPKNLDKLTDKQRAKIVVEPEAGTSKNVTVEESQEPGVGGVTIVKSPAWDGGKTLNAGEYYSNGSKHKAWDVGTRIGDPLYAAFTGKIVGAGDGVKNNKWGKNPGSGSPSNWLLLCRVQPKGTPFAGKTVVLYYQHLNPGLKVKRGQNVKLGQNVATAGNSGYSTGPHTHFAATVSQYSCTNYTQPRALWVRYLYLTDSSRTVFAPDKAWRKPTAANPKPTVNLKNLKLGLRNAQIKRLQQGLRARGANYRKLNPGGATGYYGTQTARMVKKYQRAQGFRGKDADGRIGCNSLNRLNKANGSKWTTKC